jgi:hypothetical protein
MDGRIFITHNNYLFLISLGYSTKYGLSRDQTSGSSTHYYIASAAIIAFAAMVRLHPSGIMLSTYCCMYLLRLDRRMLLKPRQMLYLPLIHRSDQLSMLFWVHSGGMKEKGNWLTFYPLITTSVPVLLEEAMQDILLLSM